MNLPCELVPNVLLPFAYDYSALYNLCLVDRTFWHAAAPLLYRYVRIRNVDLVPTVCSVPLLVLPRPGLECVHQPLCSQILRTLATCSRLGKFVQKFELRVWPLGTQSWAALERDAILALRNCENLRTLIWTRKGSLTAAIIHTFQYLCQLKTLEINATPSSDWSPSDLTSLKSISHLSLVLPNRTMCDQLCELLMQFPHLSGLALLGFASNSISDSLLYQLSDIPLSLTSFAMAGAPKVSEMALRRFIERHAAHLEILHLENLFLLPNFLSTLGPVPSLTEIRTTVAFDRAQVSAHFRAFDSLRALSESCQNLQRVAINYSRPSAPGNHPIISLSTLDVEDIASPSDRLRYLEIRGLILDRAALTTLYRLAPNLQDAILHVDWDAFITHTGLAKLAALETLHVMCSKTDVTTQDAALVLSQGLSYKCHRFGVRNRLWNVERNAAGQRRLEKYTAIFWPSFGPF